MLELSRSKFYSSRKPAAAKGRDLELMALIDKLYTERPCLGSRQMKRALESHGYRVNRKKIQRIMRIMCISSILPKPWTSTRNQEHVWIFHFNRPTVALSTGHDSDENGPIVLMTTGPIKLN